MAIRTKDDEFSAAPGREYADKVERLARGLAGLGLSPATRRDHAHQPARASTSSTRRRIHLGAAPFSIYNTYTAEQIEYLVGDAGNAIFVTEKAFLDTILAVRDKVEAVEHVIVVDGDGSDDTLTLDDLEAKGDPDFDFEGALEGGRSRTTCSR